MAPESDSAARPPADAPAADVSNADGVDLTLIRWMLALTPRERLRTLQRSINSVEKLRRARRTAG